MVEQLVGKLVAYDIGNRWTLPAAKTRSGGTECRQQVTLAFGAHTRDAGQAQPGSELILAGAIDTHRALLRAP